MNPKTEINLVTAAIVVIVVGGIAWVVFTAPTTADSERAFDARIAACRARGGEPHLDIWGNSFILKECWLSK